MNKTYRLAWNELTQSWVAVAEIVKARGKRSTRALLRGQLCAVLLPTALVAVLPAPTFAQTAPPPTTLPAGGQVVAGSASIAQSGATMNITQSTPRAAIDWQTFNVGRNATVNFIQPSSSAVILNRVLSANPSQIFGQINSNGQVFLTNPGGVYFAPGSSANVGALVATTHSIANADFMAGNHKFTRNGTTGSVINEGELSADPGGYIALLAPEVRNNGVIIAQAGTVALAAGEAFELQFSNGSLANVQVEPAAIKALVDNGHAVQAPGGLIILSARAADQLQGGVVRNSGSLEASSMIERGGVIRLEGDHLTLGAGSSLAATGATGGGEVSVGGQWQGSGDMHQATSVTMESGSRIDVSATKVGAGGTAVLWSDITRSTSQTLVNGQISARGGAQGGDGGRIETSGAFVSIGGDTRVDTLAPQGLAGIWLIDPTNFTVSAGGAAQTASGIGATTLATNLNTGSVTIQTQSTGAESGDIAVSSAVTKASGTRTTLTLAADRHVIVSAPISGTAGSPLNVVLAARARGGATGVVDVKRDIRTFGGDITIGGGDLQASGYAIATAGYYNNNAGVYIGSTSQNNSTSAMLDATGDGSGVANNVMPTAATGGNIVIRGSGSSTSAQSNLGVLIAQGAGSVGSVITGGTGSISIDGKGGNGQAYFAIGSTGILLGLNANIKANLGNITLKGTAGTGSDRYGIAADGDKLIGTNNGYVNIEGDSMLIRNGTVTINAGANSDIKAPIVGCDGGAAVSCLAYGLTKTGTGILNLSADAEAWNNARPAGTRATPTNGTFTDTSINVISPVTANGALYAFGVRPTTVNIVTAASSTPRLDITLLQSKSKTYGAANPSLVKDTDYTLSGCVTCPTLDWGSAMTLTTAAGSYGYGTGTTLATVNLFTIVGSYTLSWNYGTGLSMVVLNKAPEPPLPPTVPRPIYTPSSNPPPLVPPQAPAEGNTGASGATSGGIAISLVREPSMQQAGIITVAVPKEMATAGAGFSFPLPAEVFANAPANASVRVMLENGGPLPAWLSFMPATNSFVAAAVPDGAFPVSVIVSVGGRNTTVVVSERTE